VWSRFISALVAYQSDEVILLTTFGTVLLVDGLGSTPAAFRRHRSGNAYSAVDSAGIGLVLAAALIESETTQAAPAKAMLMALPAQLK
jgi:hypothetical protein